MKSLKSSPQRRSKTPSPIKVKDYFTNPTHKIKQPAFTEVGFTPGALNTFVRNFTNRHNARYISLYSIRAFIKSFTNNNPKLMHMYEQFFTKNFVQKEQGMIQLDHFVEFFIYEQKQQEMSIRNLRRIYKDFMPMDAASLRNKAKSLDVNLTEQQANKIIAMGNYRCNTSGKQIIEKNFLKIMNQ